MRLGRNSAAQLSPVSRFLIRPPPPFIFTERKVRTPGRPIRQAPTNRYLGKDATGPGAASAHSRHHAQHAPARDGDRQCACWRHGGERPGPKPHSTGAEGCQRRGRPGVAARAPAAARNAEHAQSASRGPGAATDGGAAHGERATLELGLAAIRLDGRPARCGGADDAWLFRRPGGADARDNLELDRWRC